MTNWASPAPDVAEMVELVEDRTQGIPTEVCVPVEYSDSTLSEYKQLIRETKTRF